MRPAEERHVVLVTAPLPPDGAWHRPRLDRASAALRSTFGAVLDRMDAEPVPWPVAQSIHRQSYLDRIVKLRGSFARVYDEHAILAGSLESILYSAGAATTAVHALVAGRAHRAFVLAEPPGHHAAADRGAGFCVLNNVACAVAYARTQGIRRILIVDWDVHHGDGTQAILSDDRDLAIIDLHQHPLFPGTGAPEEIGAGNVWNVALPAGCEDADYRWVLDRLLRPVSERLRPELVLVSCGFDSHANDPLGSMQLSNAAFGAMTAAVVRIADEFSGGRAAFILEGGYAADSVASSVVEVVRALFEPREGPVLGAASTEVRKALHATIAAHRSCCGLMP